MKQLLTAVIAGVGLLSGLNAALAAGDHKATHEVAPSQTKLAAGTNAPKDAATHPKAKAEAQGAKKATKTTGSSTGNSGA